MCKCVDLDVVANLKLEWSERTGKEVEEEEEFTGEDLANIVVGDSDDSDEGMDDSVEQIDMASV